MTQWRIERLRSDHDRAAFSCGHAMLDDWLKLRASQFDRKDLARTFVAVRPGDSSVLGYYALSSHHVSHESLPADESKGVSRLDVPVALIGPLAVDQCVRGQGLGGYLLIHALRRVGPLADEIGIRAVEVDTIDDAARKFYLKYGFKPLTDAPRHLYISTRTIRALLRLP
ncbi:MAG: GNAT family N-acetyltransferase [Pirellulales bacterium]|nr:GNAT family N-acetyltransferase [Pirellulales bacterium]